MNNVIWHNTTITNSDRNLLLNQKPFVLWFTGLSASGKSTLANIVEQKMFSMSYKTYLLDGDNVRHGLNKDLVFDDESSIEIIRRIGEVSKLFLDSGILVLTAFISPFIGRLDDINLDGLDLIGDIRLIYDNYGYETQILAASIRTANHVTQSALIGADVMTAPPSVIKSLALHPLTDKGLAAFLSDIKKTGQKII